MLMIGGGYQPVRLDVRKFSAGTIFFFTQISQQYFSTNQQRTSSACRTGCICPGTFGGHYSLLERRIIIKKNVSMWWATVANDVVYGGVVFVACNTFNPAVSVCSLVYIRNSDER